jgi:lambda family phage portal protein
MINCLQNGDILAVKQLDKPTPMNPYRLRWRLVEADRCSTPKDNNAGFVSGSLTDGTNKENGNPIYDGVEVDKGGKVVAYWICNVYPNQVYRNVTDVKWTRVSAYGKRTGLPIVLHIMMDSERPDQYRGVTYLAPVIESLLNISRYTQSELQAALIQSFFTAWIKTKTNPAEFPINEVSYGPDEDPDNPPDSYVSKHPNEYEMGPGTVITLADDEEVVFGNPNIPSSGFDMFMKVLCKEIGAALEIPYDTLLKEFNASYSASRAALMEAWEAFEMRRTRLVDSFCQPVYEAWLAEAVSIRQINAPGFFLDPMIRAAWCRAQWLGPVQGQLDPTKEVEANIMAVQHGFKTHAQVAREYSGNDWFDNMEQMRTEMKIKRDVGLATEQIAEPKSPTNDEMGGSKDDDGGEDNGQKERQQRQRPGRY